MVNHPRVLCIVALLVMWGMASLGSWLRSRNPAGKQGDPDNLSLLVPATLTLLGLIIGFTFSMATVRYDQRKLYEEQEANAIGTEYVRADLMPAAQMAQVKQSLVAYLDHRVAFYQAPYGDKVLQVDRETNLQQAVLWKEILPDAAAQPTPETALVVSGMNDVLNSAGYTQFAWWNRIPTMAWVLMLTIAVFANLLVGYATRRTREGALLLIVLPIIVSIALFLIADLDSPRGGIIHVRPVDLIALQQQLHGGQRP